MIIKIEKNHVLYNWNISLLNYNYISDQLPVSHESFIKTNAKEEATIEISDIDLPSNSSLNSTALHAEEKRRADAEWLKDVRMAIEGVTQLIVGLIGLVGKNSNDNRECTWQLSSAISVNRIINGNIQVLSIIICLWPFLAIICNSFSKSFKVDH